MVACPSCDLLFNVAQMPDDTSARCPRCGTALTTRSSKDNERLVVFSATALGMLVLACSFPFMEFGRAGLENSTTIPQIVAALWTSGMPWLSTLVGLFIIILPAVTMFMMLVIGWCLWRSLAVSWLRPLCSLVFHCTHWSMAEVFFVGVLVSLIKVAKMATIVLGASFWAYAVFTILFTLTLLSLDRFQIWRQVDELSPP